MHMSDPLISPPVGGACWAAAAGLLVLCARRVREDVRPGLAARMGVLGAFVFAAQMINVAIPGTGSSGHLGGGLLLAALLGPHAAVLVIAAVLAVQALFFGDGGLLAYGCNVLNLGFFPAFIAYPWVFRPLAGADLRGRRAATAAVTAAAAGLLLGAFGVVVQASLSGITGLSFGTFAVRMLPIHLAIGLFEGVATASVLASAAQVLPARDDLPAWRQPLLVGFLVAMLLVGGVLSGFASVRPDGLEWSVERAAGAPVGAGSRWHAWAAALQERTALLPDYAFAADAVVDDAPAPAWPAFAAATSFSGITGGLATLLLAGLAGAGLRMRGRAAAGTPP